MSTIHKCNNEECLCHDETILHSELIDFIKRHKSEVLGILKIEGENKQTQQQIELLNVKLEQNMAKLQEKEVEMSKLQKCIELKEKEQTGSHSMYKGEFRELRQEILVGNLFGNRYTIDGKKCMHKMDIRMINKEHKFTIGIETKEKKSLTPLDINKFRTDRLNNNFWGGIFVSTECGVQGFVKEKDTYKLTDNEIYIYSNDANIIGIAIGCFLHIMENKYRKHIDTTNTNVDTEYAKLEEKHNKTIEHCVALYKKWSTMKKVHLDFDKQMIISLRDMGVPEELFNGHLFLIPKSKCRGSKHPYNSIIN